MSIGYVHDTVSPSHASACRMAGPGQARLTPTQDMRRRRVQVVVGWCWVVTGMEGFAVVL